MHTFINTFLLTNAYLLVNTYIHTNIHRPTCMYTYIHAYIHTNIHTYINGNLCQLNYNTIISPTIISKYRTTGFTYKL